jgi:hypothetical protein
MATYRCYACGFETEDKGRFVCSQSDGDHHWMMFSCPQCALTPPPMAEVDHDPYCKVAYVYPKWTVLETNDGVYIRAYSKKGGSSSMPMISDHPLYNAPASLLRAGLTGSMADHHRWLCGRGKSRSEAFRADAERIRAEFADKLPPMVPRDAYLAHPMTKEREAQIDKAREQHNVGPHDDRVEHDGPTLMRKAHSRWAA